MGFLRKIVITAVFILPALAAFGQRSYKAHSVLQSGSWFKIGVAADGVCKLDVSFLNALGISGAIPSGQLRIFTRGAGMVPESNSITRIDDLEEVAIQVNDGGDGQLNGSDFALFYGQGPHTWNKDSASKRFLHVKNFYADLTYYFITVGGVGKRISLQPASPAPAATVTSFDERYFHDFDSVNFLQSGKEWFGEEFSNLPGRSVNRTFTVPSNGILPSPVTLISNVVSRSINNTSRFDVLLNNQLAHQHFIPSVGGGVNDLFAQQSVQTTVMAPQANLSVSVNYFPGSFNAQGWLNWFEVFYRRQLAMSPGQQLLFRDWLSVGNNSVLYKIGAADAATQVWDVTDPFNPNRQMLTISGGEASFTNNAMALHEYVAFSGNYLTPVAAGKIANQDLHNTIETDLIIITHSSFLSVAQKIAAFHNDKDGLRTTVVTTEQVYNEFGGGAPDPAALRDFAKMYYDRMGSPEGKGRKTGNFFTKKKQKR